MTSSPQSRPGGTLDEQGTRETGRDRMREIQRVRLLAAMADACAEYGAGSVTVGHVVERAGVSRRTFYEVFGDREACFLAAFEDALVRATTCVLDADDEQAPWEARIRTALSSLLALVDRDRTTGQLLIVGSLAAGPTALDRRRRVLEQIVAFVDEGRKRTKTGPDLPALTAEGVVGGCLSILHARLLDRTGESLIELASPLMCMIVLPYLGPAVARRESARRPARRPRSQRTNEQAGAELLGELGMRLTYRTVMVLAAVAAQPGGSNRQIAADAGIVDQGQVSKLLARLRGLGLVENEGTGGTQGGPNAWVLTDEGQRVQRAITAGIGTGAAA